MIVRMLVISFRIYRIFVKYVREAGRFVVRKSPKRK